MMGLQLAGVCCCFPLHASYRGPSHADNWQPAGVHLLPGQPQVQSTPAPPAGLPSVCHPAFCRRALLTTLLALPVHLSSARSRQLIPCPLRLCGAGSPCGRGSPGAAGTPAWMAPIPAQAPLHPQHTPPTMHTPVRGRAPSTMMLLLAPLAGRQTPIKMSNPPRSPAL